MKLWDMGVKGQMWQGMYEPSKSAVLLDGEKSNMFKCRARCSAGL